MKLAPGDSRKGDGSGYFVGSAQASERVEGRHLYVYLRMLIPLLLVMIVAMALALIVVGVRMPAKEVTIE